MNAVEARQGRGRAMALSLIHIFIAQLAALQSEIVARDIEKTAALTAGTYIGGRDIPAGDYILASAGEEGDAGIVSLRSVNDPEDEYPSKLYEFNFASEGYTCLLYTSRCV